MAEPNGRQSKFTPPDSAIGGQPAQEQDAALGGGGGSTGDLAASQSSGPANDQSPSSHSATPIGPSGTGSTNNTQDLNSTQAHNSATMDSSHDHARMNSTIPIAYLDPHHKETVDGTSWPSISPPVSTVQGSVPERIGEFHLKREIGVGGMGKVYEAVDANLGRMVAIKVIKPGYGDSVAISRFRAESQTLAKFAHPGIAQVYAAGVFQSEGDASPTPYFAMEFVPEALHITRFAEKHRLSANDRIRLFMRVCEAIEHAHRFRIIHRDLKPSNIIISDATLSATSLAMASTGGPQPKVIDFGIARTVDPEAKGQGGLVGTIEYMSPEQCEARSLDERSDVYALGVVLYQLLAKKLPYPVASCGTTQEAVEIISASRPKPLREISGELKGDIDAVVSKALEKDPEDRYQSVSRLRADLDRCLTGDAVEARWGSVGYVMQRKIASWMGLHPRTSILTFVVVLLTAVLTLGIDLIFNMTPLPQVYGFLQAKLLGAHTLQDELKHVTLITIDDSTNLNQVASQLGIENFDVDAVYQRRSMYAAVLDRLKEVSPKAVAIDVIFWSAPTDIPQEQVTERLIHTTKLSSAAERLSSVHGVPLVAVSPYFQPTGQSDDPIDPGFASKVILGGGTLSSSLPGLYICHAFVKKPGEPTMLSFALATVAAAHVEARREDSQSTPQVQAQAPNQQIALVQSLRRPAIYVSNSTLELVPATQFGFEEVATRATHGPVKLQLAEVVEMTGAERDAQELESTGITVGDQTGHYYTQLPSAQAFDRCTIELSKVLAMDTKTLAKHVDGKIVVIGNIRLEPSNGDFWKTGFGYEVPGAHIQAAAIESMMRGVSIKIMNELQVVCVSAAACILGCVGAHLLRRRALLGMLAVFAFCIAMTMVCVFLYMYFFVILNPFIALLALLAGIGAYTLVYRMHHRRAGGSRLASIV